MRNHAFIVLSILGLLVVLTLDASAQKLDRSKLKQNVETLRHQIDSLSDALKDLEDQPELRNLDSTFNDLFDNSILNWQGNIDGMPHLYWDQVPSPLLPQLPSPQFNVPMPNPSNPFFEYQPAPRLDPPQLPEPLPQQRDGAPIPGFPNWRFQLLKNICRQI